jgi:hypothetical protein
VASVLPFIEPHDGSFDPELTRAMGQAFDAAREQVGDAGQSVYEAIAEQIITAARKGERDPVRLRNAGLAGLGYESKTG